MKKLFYSIVIPFLIFILSSCNDNDESIEVIQTNISVIASQSSITWTDANDLMQKLENTLSYNYGSALESEIEKQQVFNADTTQVNTSIDFKAAFQNTYDDTNPFDNAVTIILVKDVEKPSSTRC